MKLPHKRPMFVRGLSANHPGIDTVPAGTGHWQGATRKQKDRQNKLRSNIDIVSMFEGEVVFAGYMAGAGKTVVVHSEIADMDYYFLYAHLAETFVYPGEIIEEGRVIGKMGYSGLTGPTAKDNIHLHLTVCCNPECAVTAMFHDKSVVDPMMFFEKKWNNREGAFELLAKD